MKPEDTHFYVSSRDTLGIETNLKGFKWSFGTVMQENSESEVAACKTRFRVEQGSITQPDGLGKYHYFSGSAGEDRLFYKRGWFFGSTLELEIGGLVEGRPYLKFNKTYARFVKHRFMNLHSPGYILTDAACTALLRNGLAPLHCGAFARDQQATVIFAPPNTGKTLTTMQACRDGGADFVAEDLAISDGRDILAVPWTSTFRYYGDVDPSMSARMRAAATDKVPAIELIPSKGNARITEYLAPERIAHRSRIKEVVILERGAEAVVEMDHEQAVRQIFNLNRYEFKYSTAPFAVAYEYFNPELDLAGALEKERRIIANAVASADRVVRITSFDPTRYASLLEEGGRSRA